MSVGLSTGIITSGDGVIAGLDPDVLAELATQPEKKLNKTIQDRPITDRNTTLIFWGWIGLLIGTPREQEMIGVVIIRMSRYLTIFV